jgi:predicted metal-dependent phosphoesterase TrpH
MPLRLKIDLHVHTSFSDGSGAIVDILRCAEDRGLDGLAITDHDTLEGYFRAKELECDLLLIPGYEVETEVGHVLVLGLEVLPPSVESIGYEELVGWVRSHGGLTIIAHPAISRFHIVKWKRSPPDAVEVLNASYPLEYFVRRGLKASERVGVPAVGGSDAHSPISVGDAYTVVEVQSAALDDVLGAIRAGLTRFEGRLSPIKSRFRIGLGYLKNSLF